VCDPSTGDCTTEPVSEGSSCDDDNACTGGDICIGGICGGTALNCNDDSDCTDDTCDRDTGCVNTPVTGDCDDGSACTSGDTCVDGTCTGTQLDCTALDGLCTNGVCDPATGECESESLADGSACDDGDGCTRGETCQTGVCTPAEDACQAASGCNCGPDGGGGLGAEWLPFLALLIGLRRPRLRG
jgi:hypothetical protein